MRVTDAAETLGISTSGTHRLLATLVYRGFAEQLPDRSYGPGPVMRASEPASAPVQLLRQLGPPHLRALVDRVHESANLMVRVGTEVRFLATVESDRVLRVGDRMGRALPAHLVSGGKALLASLTRDELAALYADTDVDVRGLWRTLDRVRADGHAVNRGDTEVGVTAVGMAVVGADGRPVCAVSVGLPSSRFTRGLLPQLVDALTDTRRAIERELQEQG